MDDEEKDKLAGKAKEAEGKLTGDEAREVQGKAQHGWGEAKDKAKDAADEVRDRV
jgi:uncharacterized protein YjbJ (UPF0337 family)